MTVRAIFPNKDRVLLPGMFVRAQIDEGVNEHAILVPQVGVTHDPKGQPIALIVGPDDKVVLRHLVTAGTRGADWIVASGLNPGDRVIVQGTDKVHPETLVKPVPAQLPGTPASGVAAGNAPASSVQTAQAASGTAAH